MLYPVNLKLEGEKALVVGGGRVAFDKARGLLKAGARVTAVSPEFAPAFRRLARVGRIRRAYRRGDLRGAAIVIAATNDAAVNSRVSRECRARRIPVNVVDQPRLCTFFAVSAVRRGPLLIAISTEGLAPGLAKSVRRELERLYPASIARLVREVAHARRGLKRRGGSLAALRRLTSPAVLAAWRRRRRASNHA